MKKLLFYFILVIFSSKLTAQQVPVKQVVVEIATGTWCQYCPGAAMGADDLIENGHNVAVIEHHGLDVFENTYSAARNNYYSVTGFPTTHFNGGYALVGGSSSESLYPEYLPKYNAAISEMSSFDINMEVTTLDNINFDVTVTIDKVADYSGTNLVAQLSLTESHIEYLWQGMNELNWVNRQMYPNASGSVLDFSTETQQIIQYNVSVNSPLLVENCELVAFIQDNSSKKITQATKFSLNNPLGTNNVSLQSINYPVSETEICSNAVSPEILIKNYGSNNLNSLKIEYSINGEQASVYDWTGDIAYLGTQVITLPEIIFTLIENNNLNISITETNGYTDDNIADNMQSASFLKSMETDNQISLNMNSGNWGFEISWDLRDVNENILYSGSGYENSQNISEVFTLSIDNCYTFNLYDSYGNGFNSAEGYLLLEDSDGNQILNISGNFGSLASKPFKAAVLANTGNILTDKIILYPNPVINNLTISTTSENSISNIIIYDISGKLVFEKNFSNNENIISIDTQTLDQGMYFIKIVSKNAIFTKKINVIK